MARPEIIDHGINLFWACALENHEVRLPRIATDHTVADEARAIASHDTHFTKPLPQRHRGPKRFRRGLRAPDNLKQAHHIRWTEEMHAANKLRAARAFRNCVNV